MALPSSTLHIAHESLTPWRIAAVLNLLGKNDKPICPVCSGETYSTPKWFRCATKACGAAGDGIGYLGHYTDTPEVVSRVLRNVTDAQLTDADVAELTTWLLQRAAISKRIVGILEKRDNTASTSPIISKAWAWLRRIGINASVQSRSICVVSPAQLKEIRDVGISTLPLENWPTADAPRIMIPYWCCPGVLHSLVFVEITDNPKSAVIEISQHYNTGFTGLADVDVSIGGLTLCDTAYDAFNSNTHSAAFDRSKYAIAARSNKVAITRNYAWLPTNLEVAPHDLRPSFVDLVVNVAAQGVEVTVATADGSIDWGGYLPEAITKLLSAGGDSNTLSNDEQLVTAAARLSTPLRRRIVKELGARGCIRKAEALLRAEYNRVLCDVGGGVLCERDGKYVVEKVNGTVLNITNFVLRLENAALFVDSASMSIAAAVECGDFTGKVNIPMDSFHDIKMFERTIASTRLSKVGKLNTTKEVPVIFNRTIAKHLLVYLLTESANLERCEGLSRFGWNEDNDAYYSPFGKIHSGGRDESVCVMKTSSELNGVMTAGLKLSEITTPPPGGWVDLFAIMSSIVLRSFARMPARGICLSQDSETLPSLEKFFKDLGQRRVITVNTRSDDTPVDAVLQAASGYPMLVINHSKASGMQVAGHVVLSSNVKTSLDLPDYPQAAGTWLYCLQQLVTHLLARGVGAGVLSSGVDPVVTSIREGYAVLRQITGWDITESSAHMTPMDLWLSGVDVDAVRKIATLNLTEQRVEFDLSGVEPTHATDIKVFISARVIHYSDTPVGFKIDAIAAYTMLTEFYGDTPTLAHTVTNADAMRPSVTQVISST